MKPPGHPDPADEAGLAVVGRADQGADAPATSGDAAHPDAAAPSEPRRGGLKVRVIPDPPEMDESAGRRALLFFVALVVVTVVSMSGVLVINVIADPYGYVGTHLFPTVATSDRTVKADKIEALTEGPGLIVLGSSRSMRYEPSYLQEKTGLTTFNAGVNGIGGTADAWAMTQFIHDTFPDSRPAYLWLVDVESFVPFEVGARTANEARLARYVDQASATKGTGQLVKAVWENRSSVFSLATARDSIRLFLYREKAKSSESKYRKTIMDDGAMKERRWTAKEWKRRWPRSVTRYSALYKTAYKEMDPTAEDYFERTVAFMNGQGATPLIVLSPINPKLRRVLGPLGWDERHRQVVAYLEAQQKKHEFVFLDNTDPAKFGFDPKQWYDGVHMTTINTRRAIDYILEQTGGVPPVRPAAGTE